ncbi:MAG: hypothetical protein LAO19_18385 [Acidobacteriia bacterium]|nr:hypothetical protein [Terriglobia bacterium]
MRKHMFGQIFRCNSFSAGGWTWKTIQKLLNDDKDESERMPGAQLLAKTVAFHCDSLSPAPAITFGQRDRKSIPKIKPGLAEAQHHRISHTRRQARPEQNPSKEYDW